MNIFGKTKVLLIINLNLSYHEKVNKNQFGAVT